MANYDELDHLRARADEAAQSANQLTDESWPNVESRKRLQEVLAYTRLVIENTDGALISPPLAQELDETLSTVVNTPGQLRESFPGWMDNLLTRVARLPAARGRDFEQRAKAAAGTFQRSARGRLSSLEREFDSARAEVTEVRAQVQQVGNDFAEQSSARLDEPRQAITDADTQFKERLQTYETNLETERQESLKLRAGQADAFQQAQKDRAVKADAHMAEVESELRERADQVVVSLESSWSPRPHAPTPARPFGDPVARRRAGHDPRAHNRGLAAGRNPARADRTRGTPGAQARAHDTPAAARRRRRASHSRAEPHRTRS